MHRLIEGARRNGVALLALFVALGGSSYAAVKVNGKNIRDRSVTGAKLKPDTLTGKQVREATLATVPAAQMAARASAADSADKAAAATKATSADTALIVADRYDSGTFRLATDATRDVVTFGPFAFRAECPGGFAVIKVTNSGPDAKMARLNDFMGDPIAFPGGAVRDASFPADGDNQLFADGYNEFAIANATRLLKGTSIIATDVGGADCAFRLFVEG